MKRAFISKREIVWAAAIGIAIFVVILLVQAALRSMPMTPRSLFAPPRFGAYVDRAPR